MPQFRSRQRGFVRGVGMTRSERDRANKRPKKVVFPLLPLAPEVSEGMEVSLRLQQLRVSDPALYGEAEAFARKFDESKPETEKRMMAYIEAVWQERQRQARDEQLMSLHQAARAAQVQT